MAKSFPSSRGTSQLLLFLLGLVPGLTFPDSFQAELITPSLGPTQHLVYLSIIELITLYAPICLLVYIGLDYEYLSSRDNILTHFIISRAQHRAWHLVDALKYLVNEWMDE